LREQMAQSNEDEKQKWWVWFEGEWGKKEDV